MQAHGCASHSCVILSISPGPTADGHDSHMQQANRVHCRDLPDFKNRENEQMSKV